MEKTRDENQIAPWLIKFADHTVASAYGTLNEARERAEKKKDLYGGSYEII